MANGNGVSIKALKFWGPIIGIAASAAMAWGVNVYRLGQIETEQGDQADKIEAIGDRLAGMDVRQAVMETHVEAIKEAVAKPK